MVPNDFYKVLKDFVNDLYTTFPEINSPILAEIRDATEPRTSEIDAKYNEVFEHIIKYLPDKFFEILAMNDRMFETECILLPEIDFRILWASDLTEKTRTNIWKYLKLILLIVVNSESTMFEFLNDAGMKSKFDEATADLHGFFDGADKPDAETMHDHFKEMMNGKLGDLAKEIADDTIGTPEMMQEMIKDPTKLFGLVGKVGETIERKIKSGDLTECELLEEATAMLQKMKDLPGMGGFEAMFQKFAGKGKMDVNGMEAKLAQNMKQAKTKERLQRKLAEKKKFTAGEPAERTPRAEPRPASEFDAAAEPVVKKKKGKKNRG